MEQANPYVEFDEAGHRYFVNGREAISVTQGLHKAGLIDDRWFTEYSRWRGSEVHRYTMIEDRRGTPLDLRGVPGPLRGYLKAARQYKRDCHIDQWDLIEFRVVCLSPLYAGTLDRALKRTIRDYKTNRAGNVAPWCRIQTALYGHALRPGYWWERHGVCLMPDGRYNIEIYPASNFKRDLAEGFEALTKAKETTK